MYKLMGVTKDYPKGREVVHAAFPQQPVLFLAGVSVWLGITTFISSLLRSFRAYGAVLAGTTLSLIAFGATEQPDIIIYERRIDYRFLGADMLPSSRGNLELVCARLRTLALSHTPITDAVLHHLKELKSLRELILTSTNVTDTGVPSLQAALPECAIRR